MFDLQNPIPKIVESANEINEIKQTNTLFKDFNLMPHFGTGLQQGLGFLYTLLDLCVMSPSHNACKNDIVEYAFGDSPIYSDSKGILEGAAKEEIQEQLKAVNIDDATILDMSRACYDSLANTGNAFLFLRMVNIGTEISVYLEVIPIHNIAYIATNENEIKKAVITEKFDLRYWQKYPPKIVSVTDSKGLIYLDEKDEGVFETVFHMKYSGKWYGKPKILSCMVDMFTEIRTRDNIGKISDTELTAKHILLKQRINGNNTEDEESDPNLLQKIEQLEADAIRGLITNNGRKPQSISILHYPQGVEKPSILNLQVNRDYNYNTGTLSDASSFIYSQHGWAKELTGMKSTASGLGANLLLNLFLIKNESTIKPIQNEFARHWDRILGIVNSKLTKKIETKISFADKVLLVIEKLASLNANNSKSVTQTQDKTV